MNKKRITKNVVKRFIACLMALALAIGSYVGDWGSLFVHKAYADDAMQEVDITVKVSVSGISDDTNLSEQPTDWKLKKNDDNSEIEAKSVQRGQDTLDITFSIASGTQIVSDYKLLYNHVDSEGKTRESWNGTLTENSADDSITAVCNSIKTEYKRSVISVGSIKDGETSEELNDVSISFYKEGSDAVEESVKLEKNKQYEIWLSDKDAQYTYSFSKDSDADLYNLTDTNELQDIVSIDNLIVNRKKIELNNDITIEPQDAETVIYKKDTTDKVNADELKSGIEYTLKISKINYESTTIDFTAGTSNMKMSQLTGVSDSKVTLSNKTYKVAGLGADSNATLTISKDDSKLAASNNEYTLNLGTEYIVTVKSDDATKFINSVEKQLEGSNVTVTLNGSMNNDGSWTGTLNAAEDAVDGYDGNAKVTLNTATGNASVEVVDSKLVTTDKLYINGKYSLKTNPEASTYKILQNGESKVNSKEINAFEIPVSLNPGEYTIEVYDASGNKMASKKITVAYKKIDIELYNINGNSTGDWYNSDVEIRSTKKDDFKYVWSDSDNISELPSLSDDIIKEIKADGTVEGYIYAYADRANDTSVYRSEKISIKVDKTAPEMNASVEETAEWSQSRIIKISDVSDVTSGMADSNVYISTEQKNTVEDIKKISTTETIADGKAEYIIDEEINGSRTYYLYVVDKAGNYTEKTVDIKNIDHTKPVLGASVKEIAEWSQQRTIEITASDALSGIEDSKVYISTEQKNTVEDIKKISTTAPIANGEAKHIIEEEINGSRTYYLYVVDKAGNYTEKTVDIKNIDHTKPVLNASVKETADWSQQRTIEITASDVLSGIEGSKVYISTEQKNTVEDIKKISITETIADGKATYEITKESGNSQIYYLYVVDKADNYTETTVDIKNIDRTNPSITELKYYNEGIYNDNPKGDKPAYTIEKRIESILSSNYNYFIFASKSVRIEFKVSDNLSGVKAVQYRIDGGQDYSTVIPESDGTYEIKFPSSEVAESAKKKLKFKIVDNAENELDVDNTTLIVESDKTYADKNVHETTLKAFDKSGTEFVPEESYISTDFSVKYNVKETFAGIKDVKVTKKYLSNGTATETELVKDSKALNGTFSESADEGYGTIYEYSENVSISDLADSDGEFTVTLDITYNSGRTEQIQNTYYIDKVAPKVSDNIEVKSINNDEGNLENNVTYFKDDVKITFTATDVYMDKVEGAVYKYSSGKALDKYTDGDKEEGKLNVSSTDGNYTVTFTPTDNIGADELIYIVKATDKGGHSTIKESKVFVIDKTNPTCEITELTQNKENYDKNGYVYNNIIRFAESVTVHFKADDQNLNNTLDVQVQEYNLKDDSWIVIDKGTVEKSDNGYIYTFDKTKTNTNANTEYRFVVIAKDKAGRIREDISKTFTIGYRSPKIEDVEIVYNDDESKGNTNDNTIYFNKAIKIKFTVTDEDKDTHLQSRDGVVEIVKKENGKEDEVTLYSGKDINIVQNVTDENGDEYKCELTIDTGENSDGAERYEAYINVTDDATNKAKYHSKVFVIDKKAPEVSVPYITGTPEKDNVYDNVTYYNEKVELSFTAKDTNLETVSGAVYEYKGTVDASAYANEKAVKDYTFTINNDETYKYTTTFTPENDETGANKYVFIASADDKALNNTKTVSKVFVIDKKAPEVSVPYITGTPEKDNVYDNVTYYRSNATIEFTASDTNLETVSGAVYKYIGKTDASDYVNEEPLQKYEYTVGNVETYKATAEFTPENDKTGENKYIFIASADDKAANNTKIVSKVFVIDQTNPEVYGLEVSGTPANEYDDITYYSSDAEIKFTAKDTNLEKVSGAVYVYDINKGTDYTKYTDAEKAKGSLNLQNDSNGEYKAIFTPDDKTGANKYVFIASADDKALNNTKTVSKVFVIDVTAPVITVTYDNNSPANEKYYNATRTANISILERNMNNDSVTVTVTRDGSPVGVASAFTTNGEIVEADDGSDAYIYTMDYTFAEDGDYEFSVTATDLAGNVTNTAFSDEFTIDLTKPVINISVDGAAQGQTGFYSQAVTATITVTEHNFRAEDFVFNSSSDNNGTAVGSPAIGTFSNDGDVHTATVNYDYDALTTISASYSDMAANAADDVAPITFTVDLIDPEITVSNFVENKTYGKSETVSPEITITDTNFDASAVDIKFTGGKNGVINGSISSSDVANGRVYTISGVETDDVYTIDVSVKDKSGREKTYTSKFRVNRNGSSYALGNSAQTLNKTYVKAVGEDLIVTELNVDSLSSYIITYSRGGVIRQLEENKDYTVSVSMDSNGWQLYTYAINKNLFAEEGEYTINVSSVDEAGNNSDNTAKEQNLTFVVDDTAPTQVITGIKDGGVYSEDSIDVTVEVYDNVGIKELIVELNGKETKYTEEEINANGGKIVINIPSSDSRQSLKIRTVDYAGNETNVEEYSFTVSTNAWITFKARYATNPLFWVIVAAAVLVIGGGIAFVIVRKKRKDNE